MPVVTPPFDETKLEKIWANVALLEFRRQLVGAIAFEKMVDGVVDEYEDETGVDTANCVNQAYDSANDLYSPSGIDSYTKLLLHCDGADQSTTFTDEIGRTVTAVGTAKIITAQSKFGGAGGLLGGLGNYLSVADHASFDLGSGNFSIDLWVRLTAVGQYHVIASHYQDVNNYWYCSISDTNRISFSCSNGGGSFSFYADCSLSATTWTHLEITRTGATAGKIFVNGVGQTTTWTGSGAAPAIAGALLIGFFNYGGAWATRAFDGTIDEFRFSIGTARHTSDFTPETAAYPSRQNMTLKSAAFTAAAQASKGRIFLFEEDVDAVTLNTDLLAYVSRDGGTTWTQVTLANLGAYETGKNVLGGIAEISGQPAGTSMKYKLETANNKNLKIHGTGLLWQ